jgi:hypothetical protein
MQLQLVREARGEASAGTPAGVPWEDRTAAAAWDAAAAGTGTDDGPAHAAPVRARTGADRVPGTAPVAAAGIAGQANTAAIRCLKIAGGCSPILLRREESKEVADLPGGGAGGVARVELFRRPAH